MNYIGTIIRPPSEADSIILQVTLGCSHNGCTFCSAYKDKQFAIKDKSTVEEDIEFAATYCKRQKSLFLADGDALAMGCHQLLELLEKIRRRLPWLKRINSYASPHSLLKLSEFELKELRGAGLKRIYIGVESGSDLVLKNVKKGVNRAQIIKACHRAIDSGFYLSTTVILGLGGQENSELHATETASILNTIKPKNISALTLMLPESAPLYRKHKKGDFQLLSAVEMLKELYLLIDHIKLDRVQFHANHASNYLPISGILNRDKENFLDMIAAGINHSEILKPEHHRAL